LIFTEVFLCLILQIFY